LLREERIIAPRANLLRSMVGDGGLEPPTR
jgi:hypothetical protein